MLSIDAMFSKVGMYRNLVEIRFNVQFSSIDQVRVGVLQAVHVYSARVSAGWALGPGG